MSESEIEFAPKSTSAVVIACPGATHYKVGKAMLESGLLIDNGFDALSVTPNAVVLMPQQGVDSTTVMERLAQEIEKLAATGEIRVS